MNRLCASASLRGGEVRGIQNRGRGVVGTKVGLEARLYVSVSVDGK